MSASGRPPVEWLAALVGTVPRPLVRLLYRYGLTVNPDGQNALVTFDADEPPRRLLLKDLVDDLELSDTVVPERLPRADRHPPAQGAGADRPARGGTAS